MVEEQCLRALSLELRRLHGSKVGTIEVGCRCIKRGEYDICKIMYGNEVHAPSV